MVYYSQRCPCFRGQFLHKIILLENGVRISGVVMIRDMSILPCASMPLNNDMHLHPPPPHTHTHIPGNIHVSVPLQFNVLVYNPIGRTLQALVNLPVSGDSFTVVAPNGSNIPYQVSS